MVYLIFIIRLITELSDNIKPIIKDNDIINLLVSFANKYKVSFRDSYLLLPSSLKDLTKAFNVQDKGIFPYEFVNNPNISLDYVGDIPEYKYFSKLTIEEFNEKYKGKSKDFWKRNKFNGVTPEIYANYCEEFKDKNN
jgi:hypothetical protein